MLWKAYRKRQRRMAVSRYSEESPPPELLEQIRERLQSVCAEWPRSLFERVTARAAWIEFKYDRAMTDSFRAISLRASAAVRSQKPDREDTAGSPPP
jgi:hypothetical protein